MKPRQMLSVSAGESGWLCEMPPAQATTGATPTASWSTITLMTSRCATEFRSHCVKNVTDFHPTIAGQACSSHLFLRKSGSATIRTVCSKGHCSASLRLKMHWSWWSMGPCGKGG